MKKGFFMKGSWVGASSGIALLIVVSILSINRRGREYGNAVNNALLSKARAQPAPAPIAIATFDLSSFRPEPKILLVRAGSIQFSFPQDTKRLQVGAYEFPGIDKTPVSIVAHSASLKIAHTFDQADLVSESEPTSQPASTLDIVSGKRHWFIPFNTDELDIQCMQSRTPRNSLFLSTSTQTFNANTNVLTGEWFRINATLVKQSVESGLVSGGESDAEAHGKIDAAEARLRNMSDEEFLRRAFISSESDLHKASKADDAAEIGLLLGSRWLAAPYYSLTVIAFPAGHVYAAGRGNPQAHEYFVEGFGPDGSYRWDGRIRVNTQADPEHGSHDLDIIARIGYGKKT